MAIDYRKLILYSQLGSIGNLDTGSVEVTASGTIASGTSTQFTATSSSFTTDSNFVQILVNQDNIRSSTDGLLTSTSQWINFNNNKQYQIPATSGGSPIEIPGQLYASLEGGEVSVTLNVTNPRPDSSTISATTFTLAFFVYEITA